MYISKRLAVGLFIIFIAIVLFSMPATTHADDPLIINPSFSDDVVFAAAGQEVIIQVAWAACTKGLAVAFPHSTAISMDIQLNDEPFLLVEPPSTEFWGQAHPVVGADTSACVPQTDAWWRIPWRFQLGVLAPGEYDLHFLWRQIHPFLDGGDYDGDGRPDIFPGGAITRDRDIVIIVQ